MNANWHRFKEAFQQTAQMLPGGANVKPKNRKELRTLLRHDPVFNDVRRRVFGDWRKSGLEPFTPEEGLARPGAQKYYARIKGKVTK